MSVVVLILIVLIVAPLLLAMLIAAGRWAVATRAEGHAATVDYERRPFRSHAEASRRRER